MNEEKFLWAKKEVSETGYKWLPLDQHLKDTRDIGGSLFEHWLSPGQKNNISKALGYFDNEDSKRFFQFLCQVHDIGKATAAFQLTKTFFSTKDLENILLEKLSDAGFKDVDSLILASPNKSPHNLCGQAILSWFNIDLDITSIIGSHHGIPVNKKSILNEQKSYLSNYYQVEDEDSPIFKKWHDCQKNILETALSENGYESVYDLPKVSKKAQIILTGLLIMADWISSNKQYFPLIDIEENEVKNLVERSKNAYSKWKSSDLWETVDINDIENVYQNRFGFDENEEQKIFKEIVDKIEDCGIIIFEAAMGMGKTEASLIGVEQLALKSQRKGMFFGLPTQATSNGIFPRIKDWLEKLDTKNKHGLRLCHGKAYLNDDFTSLASNINIDQIDNSSVVINEWFSGRKQTTLDDFVVGTVDQFLMMSLKQRHVFLRHLGFDKKVVVIDEVHAYDVYMDQYLMQSIRWLGAYKVPVILLSATLPAEKREKMLKSYLLGRGASSSAIKENLKNLNKEAYPMISYSDGEEIKQFYNFNKKQDKDVEIIKYQDTDILPLLKDMLEKKAIVGVIVNTVKRAQEIAKKSIEVFGEDFVELLHSSFISTDRIKKEKALIDMIGKNADRPKGKIIIGSQVIEQSLDIDFDVLITDLAPIDLILQRIGRLHRHKNENRPEEFLKPKVYVLLTNDKLDFEDGSKAVYKEYILARSQYFLPDKIKIPSQISSLVQKVYSEEDLNLNSEIYKKYNDFKSSNKKYIEAKKLKASTYLLSQEDKNKNNLIGWLDGDAVANTEEKAYAQVRDSNETIEIIALKEVGGGYGLFEDGIDISEKISDIRIAKKVSSNTIKLPASLCAYYKIDETIDELERYNMKKLANWREISWLKGSLGIIFDKDNSFVLAGYKLTYSQKLGLEYKGV